MTKVVFDTTAAGPDYAAHAGEVRDLPAKEAKELIDGGYAHAHGASETAEAGPSERAVKAPSRRAVKAPKQTRKAASTSPAGSSEAPAPDSKSK